MSGIELDDRGLLVSCPQCGQRNRLTYERLSQTFRCGKCSTELRAPGEPIEIADAASFANVTGRSELPVLVDFWASWCGPCKMVAPELAKVAAQGAGQWLVVKVSTEHLPQVAAQFGISAIPTLVLFRGGAELERQSGVMPAARIAQFIQHSVLAPR